MLFGAETETSLIRSVVDAAAYAVEKIGWPGAALLLIAVGIVWYIRRFGPKHEKEIESRTTLNDTLAVHIPKQSDTLRILADTTGDISKRMDDVADELKTGNRKIAHAIIAGSCPERQHTASAYLEDILTPDEIAAISRGKNETPPGFGQPPKR